MKKGTVLIFFILISGGCLAAEESHAVETGALRIGLKSNITVLPSVGINLNYRMIPALDLTCSVSIMPRGLADGEVILNPELGVRWYMFSARGWYLSGSAGILFGFEDGTLMDGCTPWGSIFGGYEFELGRSQLGLGAGLVTTYMLGSFLALPTLEIEFYF